MVLPKITIYEITAITVCCWFIPCSKDFSPGSMVFLTCYLYSATPCQSDCGPIFGNAITTRYDLEVFFSANCSGVAGFVSRLCLGNGFTYSENFFHGHRHIYRQ